MQKQKRAKNADTPENTTKYYLTNAKLLPEVIRAKQLGRVTDELATMLLMLARKNANRPCFNGYSYREDMVSEALANLCQNALKFDTEKYNNPFAYYTSCISNSFFQFLNSEKRHRKIRDKLLVEIGENPSFNFIDEHRSQVREGGEFKNELNDLKDQIEEAKERIKLEAAQDAERAEQKLAEAAQLEESKLLLYGDDNEDQIKEAETIFSETVREVETSTVYEGQLDSEERRFA